MHGGPKNQIGIACLHSSARGTYSFRMDEIDLRVYARKQGKTKEVGRWLQPKTVAQPRSPDVSGFKLVASLHTGAQFAAAGLDLLCEIDSMKGKPVAVCAKAASGGPVAGSYGVSLGPNGVVVARYASGGGGKIVFTGSEGK